MKKVVSVLMVLVFILMLSLASYAVENVIEEARISLYDDASNPTQAKTDLYADQKIMLSAEERFKELNEIEKTNRILSGFSKLGFGGMSLYYGNKIYNDSGSAGMWSTGIAGGMGVGLEIVGVVFSSWGILDTWFNINQVEKDYVEMTKLPSHEREKYSLEYLKTNAKEARAKRAPNLWNIFGLLSMNETQVEIEYKEYLKEHSDVNQ
jgi:hypothetical protein